MKKFVLNYTVTGTEDFVSNCELTLNGKPIRFKKEFINEVLDKVGNFKYSIYSTQLDITAPSMRYKNFSFTRNERFSLNKGKDAIWQELNELIKTIEDIENWQFEVTKITKTYTYKKELK